MNERPEEQFVRDLLETHDFKVERIAAVPDAKRADYRAELGDDVYLIEVKRLRDEPQPFSMHDVVLRDIPLGYRNKLAGVARDASRQLVSTPAREGRVFRIAWFIATGMEADALVDQLRATLYGAVDVIWNIQHDGAKAKRCYFFTFAELCRRPELDAVVIGTAERGQFCLNPFAEHVPDVRACRLRQLFGDGVVDPDAEEAAGQAYLADVEADPRDEEAVLEFLKLKYKLDFLMTFRPTKRTATARVPSSPRDDEPR